VEKSVNLRGFKLVDKPRSTHAVFSQCGL